MPRYRILTQEQRPGTIFGETFTASIPYRTVQPQAGEGYFDSLSLSVRASLTGVITLETVLDLVQPLIWSDINPRIVMRGRDLFALSTAWYADNPAFNEGATGTTDTAYGIRIPLWVTPKASENYGFAITRVAQTNVASELLQLALLSASKNTRPGGGGRIDAREIPYTSLAATGQQQVTNKLPKVGKLLGLLCFATTVPTSAAITSGIEELLLDVGKDRYVSASWSDLQAAFTNGLDFVAADASTMVKRRILQQYGFLDFRDEPIDAIANDIALSIDSQVASNATRFVPIYEVAQ